MRVILGIQEAHDASASLMVDGEIVAAAQEERFSGLKGDYGFPEGAINSCLKSAGLTTADIDYVALASHNWNPVLTKIKRNANFSVDDWVKEQTDFWKPRMFEGKDVPLWNLFKDRKDFRYDDTYDMDHLLKGYMDKSEMEQMAVIRKDTVAKRLGVDISKIHTITHEECHTFYSYFGSFIRDKALLLTAEGCGDYSNGTVSIFDPENGRKEIACTHDNHIGHIYQYMTLILGMKPAQHEYKVMGMAPYANIKEVEKSYEVFKDILKVDGMNIVFNKKPKDLYFHFRDALHGHRFDGIAGAVQKFTEELLCEWVGNCIKETGIGKVCFSGGVAQNIKAAKSIMEVDGLEDLYVCPAAGDSSLPIGACYYAMWNHLKENNKSTDVLKPLDNIYLGPEFSDEDIKKEIEASKAAERYDVYENVTYEDVAKRLAAGDIIARCSGRMEFGLRALGNRSIIADARRHETLRKINSAIKFRDFWMPFTPTVLAERADDYIVNDKKVMSPFMTMAFDSTEKARKDLVSALHPADFTARPQLLEEKRNPEYYKLLKAFEKETGAGGFLNTSFNLHGDPIVLGPKEAIYTLDNSDLDGLLMNKTLLVRRR